MTDKLSQAAAQLGRKGGKSTSPDKIRAARENGRKGGRPRAMVCWDDRTKVWYPDHEEEVTQEGARVVLHGRCVRCGEKC